MSILNPSTIKAVVLSLIWSLSVLPQEVSASIWEKFTTEHYNFEVCNASPTPYFRILKISSERHNKSLSIDPGECKSLSIEENSRIKTKKKDERYRVDDDDVSITYYDSSIGKLSLFQAAEFYKMQQGRERTYAVVRDKSGREPPFMLGIQVNRDANKIKSVTPGMPAYNAGIEAGDRIYSIDGKHMRSGIDIIDYLDNIPLERTKALSITIQKPWGEYITGDIVPEFFIENHKYYWQQNNLTAGIRSFLDSVTFGLLSANNPTLKKRMEWDQLFFSNGAMFGTAASFFVGPPIKSGAGKTGTAGRTTRKAVKTNYANSIINKRRNPFVDVRNSRAKPFKGKRA